MIARKKDVEIFESWEQVDAALRRMGELTITIQKAEGAMNVKINEAKAEAENKTVRLKDEYKALESRIQAFCEAHKDEFAKKRSKELVFGVVKFRVATSIVLKVGKDACIKALKALGLTDCIRVKEEVDKETVDKLLDDITLAKVGASRKTVDKFDCEPKLETLQEATV
jgi:phage host-nuclease inhibitor protein Gam